MGERTQRGQRRPADTSQRSRIRARRRLGFTMIEMLVAMSILLLLGSITYSQYRLFIAKSHRSEAMIALSGVYKYQHAYFAQAGRYADSFDELGFQLEGAQRIDANTLQGEFYTYTLNALAQGGVAAANYQAVASGDIDPMDPVLDILMIENDLTVVGSGGLPDEIVTALRIVILSNDLSNQTTAVVHSG